MEFSLQARGGWEDGPEEGGIARAQAARALAELAAEPRLHALLVDSGAAAALASQGAEMVGLPFAGCALRGKKGRNLKRGKTPAYFDKAWMH